MTSEGIREMIWEGTIPCVITLCPSDSNQMTKSYEYYNLIYRSTYFPLHFHEILTFFKPHLLVPEWADRSDWWLEFEGVPLRWNWPVGVLYDAMSGLDPQKLTRREPWRLTLKYRNYPDDYLLPHTSGKTLEMHWTNQIKESCYVQHGTAKPVMVLSRGDSSSLWNSVAAHDLKTFHEIFCKIAPKTISALKQIPMRLYITASDKVIDLPVKPTDYRTGKLQSLGGVLHGLLPDLFPSSRNYILAKPVLHGIVIPATALVAELFFDTHYVDGFLHFAIIPVS